MLKFLRLSNTRQHPTAPAAEEEEDQKTSQNLPPKDMSVPDGDGDPASNSKTPAMTSTATTPDSSSGASVPPENGNKPAQILIAGGGIVGLIAALAIKKHTGLIPEIHEQAHGFDPDVGAGMGLYANGLRVIRDIDPQLLKAIQEAGYPYMYRRWVRHDGSEVATSEERVLSQTHPNYGEVQEQETTGEDADGLQTLGIRRWKLQQLLHEAIEKADIPIIFNKKVLTVNLLDNGLTEVVFQDGSSRTTQVLVGADGGKSVVRTKMLQKIYQEGDAETKEEVMPSLSYTGVTCIMGVAENTKSCRGISFPVAPTTKCHGCFYPTGETEQCFQFHLPIPAEKTKKGEDPKQDSCWGNLSQQVSKEECNKLADILEIDGWNEEQFLKPLKNVTRAVRVGFVKLSPPLSHWSFKNAKGQLRTVLVGDAAHPAVPYTGQGAQQGMEDAGTLALVLKQYCLDDQGKLDLSNFEHAMKVYEGIRIPRAAKILDNSHFMGNMQLKRAQNSAYNIIKEE